MYYIYNTLYIIIIIYYMLYILFKYKENVNQQFQMIYHFSIFFQVILMSDMAYGILALWFEINLLIFDHTGNEDI